MQLLQHQMSSERAELVIAHGSWRNHKRDWSAVGWWVKNLVQLERELELEQPIRQASQAAVATGIEESSRVRPAKTHACS